MMRIVSVLVLAGLFAGPALAQIEKPSDSELNAVPPQFLNLVHGKSNLITRIRPPGGPPPGGASSAPIANPSRDPRDFTGYWFDAMAPGGQLPGGGGPVALKDAPPGVVRESKIDGNRLCIVDLGPEAESGRIYQDATKLTFVRNNQLRAWRIYFTGRHTPDAPLSYNGDSIAHWEGNTLVVDTIRLKGLITGLDADLEKGLHHVLLATPQLHVVERIHKSADGTQLIDQASWSDPSVRAAPFLVTTVYRYSADPLGYDFECEDVGDQFGPDYKAKQ